MLHNTTQQVPYSQEGRKEGKIPDSISNQGVGGYQLLATDTHKRVNVYLEREVHNLFIDEVGEQNVSEFFRLVEEEVLTSPDEERDLSLRKRARLASDRAKLKFFQQRKLIQDADYQQEERERKEAERKALVESETRAAIQKLGFKREYLRNRDHMDWSHKRTALADEVSIACRMDLQFKDLYPVVAEIVLEETDGVKS